MLVSSFRSAASRKGIILIADSLGRPTPNPCLLPALFLRPVYATLNRLPLLLFPSCSSYTANSTPCLVLKFSTTHAPIYVRASTYARLHRWQDLSKRGEGSILSRLCPFHVSRRSRDRTVSKKRKRFLFLSFSLSRYSTSTTTKRATEQFIYDPVQCPEYS